MTNINKTNVSEIEPLSQNSADIVKVEMRRFLSSVKQAGLTPQHALEIKGSHLSSAGSWEEAYRIITSVGDGGAK